MLYSVARNLRRVAGHPFNQRRFLKFVTRYIRWQLGSRLALGPMVVEYVDSTRLCIANGMTGATGNIYTGLAEFDDMSFVLHLLRPGDLLVDIGANVGSYTILGTAAGANVIAFEPVQSTFEALNLNVRVNDVGDRVETICSAVGGRSGTLRFTTSRDTMNHVAASGNETATSEISVTTLDEAIPSTSLCDTTLIKIDVEGYETEVLSGARKTLSNSKIVGLIMEVNGNGSRYGFDDNALHAHMMSFGFRPFRYDGLSRALRPLNGPNETQGNTIYLRHSSEIEQRLKNSRKFSVQGMLI